MSDTKEQLKTIARRVIQEKGVNGLSFRDLAAEAKIKSSSVHYYFPKKTDLIFEVAVDYTKAFHQEMVTIEQETRSPLKRLEKLLDLFKNNLPKRFCLCGMLAAESNQLDMKTKDVLTDSFKQTQNWIQERIKEFPGKKTASQDKAGLLMASLQGALLMDGIKGQEQYLSNVRKFIRTLG